MTCNITNTPLYPEPLPLYSRDDPDAVSIHSAAPSYVSETPTYNTSSSRQQNNVPTIHTSLLPPVDENQQSTPRGGLPAPRYAPGFQSRAQGSLSDVNMYNFNVGAWSSTNRGTNSRQYMNVARRRAASQTANTTAILNSLSAVPPPANAPANTTTSTSPSSSTPNLLASTSYPVAVGSSAEPLNPLEDPYLVGEVAAMRARSQRVYREMCLRGEEAVRHESRSWDFMVGQMADWEERGRSWSNFRQRVGQTKLLGRRLGLGGRW
ncbi:hypothetical protein P154DRAFT_148110 [Amniculicola lignicola CBS 123094]|uniref:Uncharacterized protein n=1 Tax=Amniculicola lignicola CBS 123094 TaxID=1392246 RepID=A0A6A5WNA9_9PLEO|nr:hypothetical protein P154DRAFT_148110 [Amniculicola lignicola CBS 123094]